MRTRMIAVTAALLLASATLAPAQGQTQGQQAEQGQQAPPAAAAATAPTGWTGTVDTAFRGTSTDGDEARFERYRDLRTGVNVNFQVGRQTDAWAFDAGARNIGYRDGSYAADFRNSRLRVNFLFDQIPLNYSYYSRSPWQVSEGETIRMTLPDEYQGLVQSNVPLSYQIGIPTTKLTMANGSVYAGVATPVELRSRRDTLDVGLTYAVTQAVDAEVGVRSHSRTGNMPFGAGFAFNDAAELPMPLKDRATDVDAGLAWTSNRGMLRVGWEGSWYSNQYHDAVWDNPLRLTDYNANPTTATGWDPIGYVNGNGPGTGRLALAPDNSMQVVSALGMAKFARNTTLNGNVAFIWMNQDDSIIPWTTNSVIANPTVYGLYPGLAQLPRSTAQAEVRATNVGLNFRARPHRIVNLTARYRYDSRDNKTPIFDASNSVRFDAVPEDEPGNETLPYKITNNKLDVDAAFSVLPRTSVTLGYSFANTSKTYLVWRDLNDNTLRAAVDTFGNEWVTFRGSIERTWRRGSNFHADWLEDAGAQPASRAFDDSERSRWRGVLMAVVTPLPQVDVTGSLTFTRDKYDDPGQEFGLLEANNTGWGIGLNYTPTQMIAMGIDFARETLGTFQRSRNANPPPDPSWTNPAFNWELDNGQDTNSVGIYLDLTKPIAKTDIRFGYDYNDGGNAFDYGGPRIATLSNLGTFITLPSLDYKWHRATFDVRYALNPRVGLGAAYWYEKFSEDNDWGTLDQLGPQGLYPEGGFRIDWLGAITTGYGTRPYTGHTAFLRVYYMF